LKKSFVAERLVDDVLSIWECEVEKPQVIHRGSIEADHRYDNMYGIVAVPLDAKHLSR
jgi:hypothetical protein